MNLYEIVKALQDAKGSNAKLALLQEHKDNELLKEYLRATYDPSLSYYQKSAPKPARSGTVEFGLYHIKSVIVMLAERELTGSMAKGWLQDLVNVLNAEGQELLSLMISRSIGAGIGSAMVLKAFPQLFFIPGYMRCSLLDDKAKKMLSKAGEFICQKKADGAFGYLIQDDEMSKGFTRSGTAMPQWFVSRLMKGCCKGSYVFVGEMLVYEDVSSHGHLVLLDRQTGNGIINSILKGESEENLKQYTFIMEAWDLLPLAKFEEGFCGIGYEDRLAELVFVSQDFINIEPIESVVVKSLAEAKAITSKYQRDGFEGGVYKTKDSPWKDHTSPFNIKDKIAFEAEYVVTGTFEGQGKYKGMLGGFNIETSDGLLKCSVGTGFTDAMRKNPPASVGGIITVVANDVVSRRDSPFKSLFLPVYSEVRLDKTEADSLGRVMEQLAAAKGII